MTLPQAGIIEIRSTGNDLNAGGFVAGGSGSDYSQQDAAQLSLTDLACANTTTLTSVTGGFTALMVDNYLQIASGTHFTAGFYRVVSRSDTNTIVLDRNPTDGSNASAGVGKIGGALATIGQGLAAAVIGNKGFIRGNATYQTAAGYTVAQDATVSNVQMPTQWYGYAVTRGDNGFVGGVDQRPVLQLITNPNLTGLNFTGKNNVFYNIVIDANNLAGSTCAFSSVGVPTGFDTNGFETCKFLNWKANGFQIDNGHGLSYQNEYMGGGSAATAAIQITANGGGHFIANYVHDNACAGANDSGSIFLLNVITNNSGATSDGINCFGGGGLYFQNTIHNSGRTGINFTGSTTYTGNNWWNNVLTSNAGYGARLFAAGCPASPPFDGNAYWNNTLGTRQFMDDVGAVNPQNAVTPYTNVFDAVLSVNPYVNATGGDYRLNNTTGGGLACQAIGQPGTIPGALAVVGMDLGAFQHTALVAGGGGSGLSGLSGLSGIF